MSSGELPAEVQAVLDAALEYTSTGEGFQQLDRAARAYRKSIAPPEPFEVVMSIFADGSKRIAQGEWPPEIPVERWKVTITATERVR